MLNPPIQLVLNVYYTADDSGTSGFHSFSQYDNKGRKWKPEIAQDYSNLLFSHLREINCIVEKKNTHAELNLDIGIDELSDLMYNSAFNILGKKGGTGPCVNKPIRKFDSSLFNGAFEIGFREFRSPCHACKKCKLSLNKDFMLICCNNYRNVKKLVKRKYRDEKSVPTKYFKSIAY